MRIGFEGGQRLLDNRRYHTSNIIVFPYSFRDAFRKIKGLITPLDGNL